MSPRSTLILVLLFCAGHCMAQTESEPLNIGVIEKFHSNILGETRTINIYLPQGYDKDDSVKYPVIYIPDGGIDEDFLHITGIVQYYTQPWINRFPKSIVVGIENTDRKRDFTFAVTNLDFLKKTGYTKGYMPRYGGSANYISFLEKELEPFIKNKYKANGHNTIIGESLAGLLCTEILLKYPVLFDTYIIISPSLWWGGEILLKQADSLLKKNLKQKIKVCVSVPDKKEDASMYEEAKSLYATLQKNENITVFFDYLPGELHSTVIHEAVYNSFRLLYPKGTFSK